MQCIIIFDIIFFDCRLGHYKFVLGEMLTNRLTLIIMIS